MDTDVAWKQWGAQDPYFGVLSDPKFRQDSVEAHKAEFFASGEADVAAVLDLVDHVYGPVAKRVAVDFGCGVGRLTIPIARRYGAVTGIDVSEGMVAEARRNCADQGVKTVSFVNTVDQIPLGTADLVHSRIVLQHIRPARGMAIIGRLLDGLAEGGIAALHVTAFRKLSPVKEAIYQVKHRVPGARVLFNLIQGKRLSEPLMQMNNYPLDDLLDLYRRKGMKDILLQPTFGSSYAFIVYGRKCGASCGKDAAREGDGLRVSVPADDGPGAEHGSLLSV